MRWTRNRTDPAVAPPSVGWRLQILFVLLAVAAVTTLFVDSSTAAALMSLSAIVALTTASRLFIVRSRKLAPEERRAWLLFGTGLGMGAFGVAVFSGAWFFNHDLPVFGPIDLLWLSGYAIVIAGLASLPHTAGSGWQRIRLLLDGVIGAVAVGSLLWTLSLRGLTMNLRTAGIWERFVGSSYVLLDAVVLVVLMIVVVRRSTYRFDIRLVPITLAVIAQGIADVGFLSSGTGRSFTEADPIFPLNILAVTLFLSAATIVDREPTRREYADRSATPTWALLLPYSFAGAMVALLVIRVPQSGISGSDIGLLHATLLVGGLVITRQAVAFRENRRLIEDQRTALVASISHELRTPLTAVVGFLEILDEQDPQDAHERREITAIASQQASHLSRIVSDLLTLASGDISAVELDIAATAIDELAWASIDSAVVDATRVRIDTERGVTAFLDTARMQQALGNLLANAERYGGDNTLLIAKTNHGALVLEVHDDGPGVPHKHELMIWEKFERGPNRLNATVPGSGIGLAITNAIATAHGGSVGYRRSERLGGACFWIRLPGRIHADAGYSASDGSTNLTVLTGRRDIKSA